MDGAKALVPMVSALLAAGSIALLPGCAPTKTASVSTSRMPKGCLKVPADLVDAIMTGTEDGDPLAPLTAVRSGARKVTRHNATVYYLAIKFHTSASKDRLTGVWATGSLNDSAGHWVIAVNGAAQEFTVFPRAGEGKLPPGNSGDVDRAKHCVGS